MKNLEKFEQEYAQEINTFKSVSFQNVNIPKFTFGGNGTVSPYASSTSSYKFMFSKAMSIAFAVPALALMFGLFMYGGNEQIQNKNLALLEDSNNRILEQINSLDESAK